MKVTDAMVSAALGEYRTSLQSDPRNTDQMRDRTGVLLAMQRDAMRNALGTALVVAVTKQRT
jgi:hypothetical protein